MKHIIVFLAFENLDIIKTSFDSIKSANADFFIIENYSKNSDEIKKYFLDEKYFLGEKLIKYIQFEKNAAANALNILIRDYYDLLNEYHFITITDGDLFCYDIKETFNEIISAFDHPECYVSGVSLYDGNNYLAQNRVVGILPYIEEIQNKTNVIPNPIIGKTGCHLMTIANKNLPLFKDIHFLDSNIFCKAEDIGGKWFETTKNTAYHLTWDLYFDGNPYYENKKNNLVEIWSHSNEDFKYIEII
jgi:hypothetical protein